VRGTLYHKQRVMSNTRTVRVGRWGVSLRRLEGTSIF
jgi:hypothetical protein